MEQVILVDEQDVQIGLMEKQQAHVEGLLHRAISVFIFNTNGKMLLHRRAAGKYHSSLLWTNACCSHPRDGERPIDAATRRLKEEMGLRCKLKKAFTFTYRASLDNGLIEHEYDHVFVGVTDSIPQPAESEVADWIYMSIPYLKEELATNPNKFTPWFRICMEKSEQQIFDTIK